ncbi:MAG: hypothetical protein ACK502_08140 [Alphaproteobacteria bacterium]
MKSSLFLASFLALSITATSQASAQMLPIPPKAGGMCKGDSVYVSEDCSLMCLCTWRAPLLPNNGIWECFDPRITRGIPVLIHALDELGKCLDDTDRDLGTAGGR